MTVAETAPPPPLTLLEADKLAREIIDEVGRDHVYHMEPGMGVCQYVRDGQPDCFVARILYRHGVAVATLSLWEGGSAADMAQERVCNGTPALLAGDAARFLDDLQDKQDAGRPWGEAYDYAVQCHLKRSMESAESTVTPQGGEHRDH